MAQSTSRRGKIAPGILPGGLWCLQPPRRELLCRGDFQLGPCGSRTRSVTESHRVCSQQLRGKQHMGTSPGQAGGLRAAPRSCSATGLKEQLHQLQRADLLLLPIPNSSQAQTQTLQASSCFNYLKILTLVVYFQGLLPRSTILSLKKKKRIKYLKPFPHSAGEV